MKALSIDGQSHELKELELNMTANTVYTFFSSILIDELEGIKEHIIYSDANALGEKKQAYFIGERLVLGDALVFGREAISDVDVKITQEELASLINPNINEFYKSVLELLAQSEMNLYRTFVVEKNGEKLALNAEWVLYTFNIADERTKEYFINELKKVLEADESVAEYIQKMAQLAMNAAG
ncbi:hypothetical protein [Sulfurimonas sp.]|uniref:hypothetical protein n=1 Tax=Sulfurimonas sp. TaxID=2022749 RepID=UPI00261E0A8F|nr:hypothetical protein [Sulfurimonas sp.]